MSLFKSIINQVITIDRVTVSGSGPARHSVLREWYVELEVTPWLSESYYEKWFYYDDGWVNDAGAQPSRKRRKLLEKERIKLIRLKVAPWVKEQSL